LKSAISDIEIEHRSSESKLYYLKYPLPNNQQTKQKRCANYELTFVRVIIQNKEEKILMLKEKK